MPTVYEELTHLQCEAYSRLKAAECENEQAKIRADYAWTQQQEALLAWRAARDTNTEYAAMAQLTLANAAYDDAQDATTYTDSAHRQAEQDQCMLGRWKERYYEKLSMRTGAIPALADLDRRLADKIGKYKASRADAMLAAYREHCQPLYTECPAAYLASRRQA